MKSFHRLIVIVIINSLLSILHCSCTQDGYDKGEGQYSYLLGDFVEAKIGADKNIVSLMTDEGETLPLSKPYTAKWITRSDTVYRCMLYYNKVRDSKGQDVAEPISVGEVPCPVIIPLSELEVEMKTDPVKFESAWMSKTGKYINLSFALKTGTTEDDEAIHSLRVVQDTIKMNPDGTSTSYLRLYHDQGGVPDYYSTQVYASIITSEVLADSACITINTYKGIVTKTFQINKE
jgi:hypothetical protein